MSHSTSFPMMMFCCLIQHAGMFRETDSCHVVFAKVRSGFIGTMSKSTSEKAQVSSPNPIIEQLDAARIIMIRVDMTSEAARFAGKMQLRTRPD